MKPIAVLEEALVLLESYEGDPESFELPIAESLLDAVGLNMAIIGDRVLARGW